MQYRNIQVPGYLQRYRTFNSEVVPKLLEDGKRLIELIAEELGLGPCSFVDFEEKDTLMSSGWPVVLSQSVQAKAKHAAFAKAVATFTVWNPKDGESWDLEIVVLQKGKQPFKLSILSDQTDSIFGLITEEDPTEILPFFERAFRRFAAP